MYQTEEEIFDFYEGLRTRYPEDFKRVTDRLRIKKKGVTKSKPEQTHYEYKPKYKDAKSLFEGAVTRVDRENLLERKDQPPEVGHYNPKFTEVEK